MELNNCLGFCVNPGGCNYCFIKDFEKFFNEYNPENFYLDPLILDTMFLKKVPEEKIKINSDFENKDVSKRKRCKEHKRCYSKCKICNPNCMCKHGNIKYTCKEGCLCKHKRLKFKCDLCISAEGALSQNTNLLLAAPSEPGTSAEGALS